jgi:subtilisin family serine protease
VLTTVIPPAFGHGTMVAGRVRRAAPGARILPIKTFDGEGRSDTATILQAIYWALEQNVDVLNLSFSLEATTPELELAIATALERGVYVVAAAGNRATSQPSFPGTVEGVEVVAAVELPPEAGLGAGRLDLEKVIVEGLP